jgi:hypothetical protein
MSKYARKQLIDRAPPVTSAVTPTYKPDVPTTMASPAPPPEPRVATACDEPREVSGTVSRIFSKGFLFLMTDGAISERVFVHASLYNSFVEPQISDKMWCQVNRNKHGLQATKVFRIEKSVSA